MSDKKQGTPLLDELEKGPWPSFVKELKKEAGRPMVRDLLGTLERSYEEHIGHWKHGGLVGVLGYGGGVIGRYSHCSFAARGQGTYLPHEGARPFRGEVAVRQ